MADRSGLAAILRTSSEPFNLTEADKDAYGRDEGHVAVCAFFGLDHF